MKRFLFAIAIIATILVSCTTNNGEHQAPIVASADFEATFAEDIRAELDGTAVVWNSDDLLTVFTETSHNRKYKIETLSDDCRTATFRYVGYTGSDNTPISESYALYPYDATATFAGGVVTTTLSATQNYNGDENNLKYALMAAKSTTTNFAFKNTINQCTNKRR